jgi:hypothetical protein
MRRRLPPRFTATWTVESAPETKILPTRGLLGLALRNNPAYPHKARESRDSYSSRRDKAQRRFHAFAGLAPVAARITVVL